MPFQLLFKPKSAKIAKIAKIHITQPALGPSSSSVTQANPDIPAQSSSSSRQSDNDVPGLTCQLYDGSQTMQNNLSVMFPGLKEDVIARVVSSTQAIEEAVDTVLQIQACMTMNESDDGKVLSIISKDDVQQYCRHNEQPQILTSQITLLVFQLS